MRLVWGQWKGQGKLLGEEDWKALEGLVHHRKDFSLVGLNRERA